MKKNTEKKTKKGTNRRMREKYDKYIINDIFFFRIYIFIIGLQFTHRLCATWKTTMANVNEFDRTNKADSVKVFHLGTAKDGEMRTANFFV